MFEQRRAVNAQFHEIDPSDVAALSAEQRASVQLVDVREPQEWIGELGHIADAVKVPLGTFLQSGAPEPLDPARPVVMVCRSGKRSARAALGAAAMGCTDVYNLAGGMIAWNEAGLPVTR